jgi:hypothetical protein
MESRETHDYDPIAERPGTIIGPYKLLEQIGEGGFAEYCQRNHYNTVSGVPKQPFQQKLVTNCTSSL